MAASTHAHQTELGTVAGSQAVHEGPAPVSPGETLRPLWKRTLVPAIISERHAIVAFLVGFALEAGSEIYQFVVTVRSVQTSAFGYYLSLGTTLLGFYFFWRGFHEWNRLHPRPPRPRRRSVSRPFLLLLLGGIVAVAALDFLVGAVGASWPHAVLAWVVGGVIVAAFGMFFLSLEMIVSPYQHRWGLASGWAAFAWSLGVSVLAGLALGQVIVQLVVDFFTNFPQLFVDLAPFIFALAWLFVAYGLYIVAYLDAYGRAPGTSRRRSPPS